MTQAVQEFRFILSEPQPIKTLGEYLEFQIGFLKDAIQTMRPVEDLCPALSFVASDGRYGLGFTEFGDGQDKAQQMVAFRGLLEEVDAVQYGITAAAWEVVLLKPSPEEMEAVMAEGTARYKETRKEIYHVTVGDKDATRVVALDVVRDAKNVIVDLVRRPEVISPDLEGRMVGLLQKSPTVH
jgi:hypothetical protein